jgi:3-oxoacyl-[acyl-carrier protein] reductase
MGVLDERSGLDGAVAVVAGGAGGLGEAVTRDLVRSGVEVAVCDRDGEAVERLVAELGAGGAAVPLAEVLDVRDHEALEAFFGRVGERWPRLDILVNVVGGTFRAPFAETRPKGWDALIRTNFLHVVDATWLAIPLMRRSGDGGSIVNLTTIEAHRAAPNFAVYSAMKAAVTQFARSLSVELAPEQIRVNNVAPDIVPTPGMFGIGDNDAGAGVADPFGAAIAVPMGRVGVPEDVSNAVLFLASRLSSYITGATLHPDGGALASSGWFNWPEEGFRNTVPAPILDRLRPAGD